MARAGALQDGVAGGTARLPHQKFLNVPVLDPTAPITITNQPVRVEFLAGEPDANMSARLRLEFKHLSGLNKLRFALNGHALEGGAMAGLWMELEAPQATLCRGRNLLTISPPDSEKYEVVLADLQLVVRPTG